MKNFYLPLMFCLFLAFSAFSQVGINTTEPTADLDINGTLRLRQLGSSESRPVNANAVLGVDEHGNIIEIQMDRNLFIENNTINYTDRQTYIYSRPLLNTGILNNATDIIWPGGTGNRRPVVKISNILGNLLFNGIDMSAFATPMDAHGYVVTIYSVSGNLLLGNEILTSLPINRFRLPGGLPITIERYEMVKLMYDGELERWLVMSRN